MKRYHYTVFSDALTSHLLSTYYTNNVTNSVNVSVSGSITFACGTNSKCLTHFLKSTDNHKVTSLSQLKLCPATETRWKTSPLHPPPSQSSFSLSSSHVHPSMHPAFIYVLPLVLHPILILHPDWLSQTKEAVSKRHQKESRVGHWMWPLR